MTICDKIQNIGNTLESNLNDRGVSCTFGTGTGEQTIYDMAKLITEQNIHGIGDTNIQIIPNRPYVTSGETIDITVRLLNGIGNPLINKNIIITDGTNIYNGTTDTNGLFTLFNQTITTSTTYTVSYETETASKTIQLCEFADLTGDTSKYIYDSRCTVTSNNNEITVTWVSGTYIFWANKDDTSTEFDYTGDFTVEFDLTSTGTNTSIQIYDNSATNYYSKTLNQLNGMNPCHIKIVKSGQTFKTYINDVEKTAQQVDSNITGACRVGFRTNATSTIKFKNLRIY